MATIISLGKARKQRARAGKEKLAQRNRTRFGRTKAEKERDRVELEQASKRLAGHRLDKPKDD